MKLRTNGADDRGTTVILRRLEFRIQLGGPLQLHTVGEMIVSGRHRAGQWRAQLG